MGARSQQVPGNVQSPPRRGERARPGRGPPDCDSEPCQRRTVDADWCDAVGVVPACPAYVDHLLHGLGAVPHLHHPCLPLMSWAANGCPSAVQRRADKSYGLLLSQGILHFRCGRLRQGGREQAHGGRGRTAAPRPPGPRLALRAAGALGMGDSGLLPGHPWPAPPAQAEHGQPALGVQLLLGHPRHGARGHRRDVLCVRGRRCGPRLQDRLPSCCEPPAGPQPPKPRRAPLHRCVDPVALR
mmetsp:Transcript_28997/g.83095  ORF Transcript_28997/g.83095 Transcript_28997/m.83095 type:complete len:242 (-) Transcript_28997:125-850(-)